MSRCVVVGMRIVYPLLHVFFKFSIFINENTLVNLQFHAHLFFLTCFCLGDDQLIRIHPLRKKCSLTHTHTYTYTHAHAYIFPPFDRCARATFKKNILAIIASQKSIVR